LESPKSDNQAQNQLKNTGDTAGDTNTIARQVSPEENSQNQAQNEYSGDTGYTGDILHTSPPAPPTSIHRLGRSDTFACENCNLKGDKWFMRQHICRGQSK
jgi:hypothetical protein